MLATDGCGSLSERLFPGMSGRLGLGLDFRRYSPLRIPTRDPWNGLGSRLRSMLKSSPDAQPHAVLRSNTREQMGPGIRHSESGIADSRRAYLYICLIWTAIQVFFFSSAFRVDEPYYLAITKQIFAHPFNPYGFQINWLGTPEPVISSFANSPLVPAWLAAWNLVFPLSEFWCRLGVFPFSLAALHGFRLLVGSLRLNREIALALLCCSPAFFLGSQVAFLDVPMLAFFLLALAYAQVYEEKGTALRFWVAFLAAVCCPLAKVNGILLVPVLFSCLFNRRRKLGLAAIATAPILALAAWNGFTWVIYGTPHLLALKGWEKSLVPRVDLFQTIFSLLSSVGIGVVPLCLFPFLLLVNSIRKPLLIGMGILIPAGTWLGLEMGYPPSSACLFALSVTISLLLFAWVCVRGVRLVASPDPEKFFLFVWIAAVVAFQLAQRVTTVRYVLLLAPPFIILILVLLDQIRHLHFRNPTAVAVIALNLIFVVAVAVADAKTANGYRATVRNEIIPVLNRGPRNFYFAGGWGFKHYAEQIGGQRLDASNQQKLGIGDLVVIATTAWPGLLEPHVSEGQELHLRLVDFNPNSYLRTIDCRVGANFYGSRTTGCKLTTLLPFGFGDQPCERFLFFAVASKPR